MLSTSLDPTRADHEVLCARWQPDADGSLVCRWGHEHMAVSAAPASPFRLTGRQRLPARSTALHALTAALEDPPTAA
jgi:hypothetical protein